MTTFLVRFYKVSRFSQQGESLIDLEFQRLVSKGAINEVPSCDNELISTL